MAEKTMTNNKLGRHGTNMKIAMFLFVALSMSVLMRYQYIKKYPTISHDEAITYLSATGNQSEYASVENNKAYPYAKWVRAEEWKNFFKIKESFIFKKIKYDLSNYDVHPPLYFWILHIWLIIFGVHPWSGPLLNILIHMINFILLYFFAKLILKNRYEASAVVFTYSFSPGVMEACFLARSYELFTFFSILLSWKTIKILSIEEQPNYWNLLLLAVITTGGMLTHYYFGLFLTGVGVLPLLYFIKIVPLKSYKWIKEKAVGIYVSIAIGVAVFFFLNTGFFKQFFMFESQGQKFHFTDFILRVLKVGLAFTGYFVKVTRRGMPDTSLIILFGLCIVLSVSFIIYLKRHKNSIDKTFYKIKNRFTSEDRIVLLSFNFATIVALIVVLYISFFTHQAVMGPRYLSPLFPIFAFLPIYFLRQWRKPKRVIAIFCASMLVSGIFCTRPWYKYGTGTKNIVDSSENILIDNIRRGVLLRYMIHIPDDKYVYCAMQDDLLLDIDWIRGINESGLYISESSYGNTIEKRNKITNIINKKYKVILPDKGKWGIWGLGKLYVIRKK